jgi:hypothetical protein
MSKDKIFSRIEKDQIGESTYGFFIFTTLPCMTLTLSGIVLNAVKSVISPPVLP